MKLIHAGFGETKEYVTWLLTLTHFAFGSLLRACFVLTKAVLRWLIFVPVVSSWQLSRIASTDFVVVCKVQNAPSKKECRDSCESA